MKLFVNILVGGVCAAAVILAARWATAQWVNRTNKNNETEVQ